MVWFKKQSVVTKVYCVMLYMAFQAITNVIYFEVNALRKKRFKVKCETTESTCNSVNIIRNIIYNKVQNFVQHTSVTPHVIGGMLLNTFFFKGMIPCYAMHELIIKNLPNLFTNKCKP